MSMRPPNRALVHVRPDGLGPYVPGLRALEAAITYPAGAVSFAIDHGPGYHEFFSTMGDAHFAVATEDAVVVGSVAGVRKDVRFGSARVPAVYVCDLKVTRARRGTGLARRMLGFGLYRLLATPELREARLVYGAAMHGPEGDVMRSKRGLSPLRLARPWARCALYFVEPQRLAKLAGTCPETPPLESGLDLSPDAVHESPGWVSTAGRKDLRVVSTGHAWALTHLPLGPDAWRPTLGDYLRRCGEALLESGRVDLACFCLDERLDRHREWLSAQGLDPGASLTIHGLDPTRRARRAEWVHLASSEI